MTFILLINLNVQASEQDSFQAQFALLSDSSQSINQLINEKIALAIKQTNKIKGCSTKRLTHYLKYFLASANIVGINDIEDSINRSFEIHRFEKSFKDSVFHKLSFIESIALNTYGLGPMVRINNQIIGTDKIGHFLSEGYTYFEKSSERKWDVNKALYYGHTTESGLFGFFMTGVYSYADLVANFNGFRFWNKITNSNQPILQHDESLPQYITCHNDLWMPSTPFKIEDYIDEGWDETINCNKYANLNIEKKIQNEIGILEGKFKINLQCPRDLSSCQKLNLKYTLYANQLLHPICH